MARKAIDSEYLSSVWGRINSVITEQRTNKKVVAEKCGFSRKNLYHCGNLTLTYFARLCEELNVSADFFLFDLDKEKERTNKAMYQLDVCYEDMQKPQEIIKEAKKLMNYKGNNISINNLIGISAQKDLLTLADDFCLLQREDVRKIIETCKSYAEGQQKIMRVYTAIYLK